MLLRVLHNRPLTFISLQFLQRDIDEVVMEGLDRWNAFGDVNPLHEIRHVFRSLLGEPHSQSAGLEKAGLGVVVVECCSKEG